MYFSWNHLYVVWPQICANIVFHIKGKQHKDKCSIFFLIIFGFGSWKICLKVNKKKPWVCDMEVVSSLETYNDIFFYLKPLAKFDSNLIVIFLSVLVFINKSDDEHLINMSTITINRTRINATNDLLCWNYDVCR